MSGMISGIIEPNKKILSQIRSYIIHVKYRLYFILLKVSFQYKITISVNQVRGKKASAGPLHRRALIKWLDVIENNALMHNFCQSLIVLKKKSAPRIHLVFILKP